MDNHWAVTTSSGRRVSLLCEELNDYAISCAAAASSSPSPPPSPDYRRPYAPLRTDSIGSTSSSTSSLSSRSSQGLYSPQTPPNMSLPPLEKLFAVPQPALFSGKYAVDGCGSPVLGPAATATPVDCSLSPTGTHTSVPLSPKTTALAPAPAPAPAPTPASASAPAAGPGKRTNRRYACHCGKSFTTSGHLARHTRIHTGEKNYVCPEAGCAARFSRQDNCMQHFRTHRGGAGSKRAVRKRRMSADVAVPQQPPPRPLPETVPQPSPLSLATPATPGPEPEPEPPLRADPYAAPQQPHMHASYFEPLGSDAGLAALANVACSGYS